jgi:hypothetical protein
MHKTCSKSGYKELYNSSVLNLEPHAFWWKMTRELHNFWVAELFRLELTFIFLEWNSLTYISIYVYVVLKFHSYIFHIKSSHLLWGSLLLLDVLVIVLFLLFSILSECTLLKILLALTCSLIQLIGIVSLSLTMKGFFSMISSNCFQLCSLSILFRCRSWLVKYFCHAPLQVCFMSILLHICFQFSIQYLYFLIYLRWCYWIAAM